MKRKNIKMISGILLAPLMIGGRALIYHAGGFLRTSTIVAIHSSGNHHIRFETMNTSYVLLLEPTPQVAILPSEVSLAA